MTKKVRFPLEMDGGIEVRSLEELRENFSLSRILGYVEDGRLVTWLRDRYESEMADAIENINISRDDMPKVLCRLFGVVLDEKALNEVEKAKERRKLVLLKKYPECSKYVKVIDQIAFNQEDLYDLLDEDVKEIYLCGNRFTVPVSIENQKYIGINGKVIVNIESKEVVDFRGKRISFENCVFDEKYERLMESSMENHKEIEVKYNSKSEGQPKGKAIELPDNVDIDEVDSFVEDVKEVINDFASKKYENDNDELYEYYGTIECDANEYNDSGFTTKAKAKAACKAKLTIAINDAKGLYEDAKKELIEATETYYDGLKESLLDFLPEFYESCTELLDVYCTGGTWNYIEGRVAEKKKEMPVKKWEGEIRKRCIDAIEMTKKSLFGEEDNLNVKDLFGMCEYNEEDEDDYSYSMYDACDLILLSLENRITKEAEFFPKQIYKQYLSVKQEYLVMLSQWIDTLRSGR